MPLYLASTPWPYAMSNSVSEVISIVITL
jgi:hypothetical protein